jgi:hypothetical protein
MKRRQVIIILVLTTFISACLDTAKPLKVKDSQKIIEMSKGPCLGDCPVFDLVIYETGIATFNGKQYTDRQGLFMKNIGKEKVKQITNTCVAANLWQFQDIYKSNVPDLPTVTITYFEGKEKKTIAGKKERPIAILDIESMLEDVAFSTNWERVEDAPSDLPPGAIPNELVVKLNRNVEGLAWSKRYIQQGMVLKKPLSADKTYWLITFDDKVIKPKEMAEMIRKDPDVFSVQFNQNYQ